MNIIPADIIKMTDKHEKGRALEYLSELLLASHHHNATRISTPTPDKGIDRMGLLPDGTYVALQSKAYESKTVGKHGWQAFTDEVRRVNREGEKRITQAVMFATAHDGASRNAEPSIDMLRAEVAVSEWYRDDLLSPDNAYLWDVDVKRPESLSPRPHQDAAVRDAKKLKKRGKVIMATGTGKTLISAELIKHFGPLCLYLVPNMELVRQISLSFARDIPDAKLLAVFSGEDVRDGHSGLNITAPATTDPTLIREFAKTDGLRVIISTYQSSGKVSEALKGITVNFAVLDEAHRTVGGASKSAKGGFQVCMTDGGIKIKRRLFMTATPKMHGIKAKEDAEEKSYILYSMDDEGQYGQELHRLQPGKAIEDGLLAPFDVMAGLFRHARAKQYLKTDAKKYAQDIDSKKMTVEDVYRAAFLLLTAQEENLSRTLVFTSTVERARLAANALNTMASRLGIRGYAHVISHTSTPEQRREALGDLAHGKFGFDHVFVINVDLFTEGVDIPALDGVVFIDSRKSVIAIAQAVGRALRLDPANPTKRAKIIIPVMITEQQDIDKVIDKGAFKAIRDYTIAIQDVGFNPEQTVMLAKETGAKTLGNAWSDSEGVEWVKWANSDIDRNQKCIETVLLGGPWRRYTNEEVQRMFATTGLIIDAGYVYKDSKNKIPFTCSSGHRGGVSLGDYKASIARGSSGCRLCGAKQDWSVVRLQELSARLHLSPIQIPENFQAKTKIKFKCANGHIREWTPDQLSNGQFDNFDEAPCCSGKQPYTRERFIADIERGGFKCLDDIPDVITSQPRMLFRVQCANGHVTTKAPTDAAKGTTCSVCVRGPRWDIVRLRNVMSQVGLTVLEIPSHLHAKSKIKVSCEFGHETLKTPDQAKKGGCNTCAKVKSAKTRQQNDPNRLSYQHSPHKNGLTENDVVEIRKFYAEGATVRQVSEKFGIKLANAEQVCYGRTWKWVVEGAKC